MTKDVLPPIYFLKGGHNSVHKIQALEDIIPNPVIPIVVSAPEPDHHSEAGVLLNEKYKAFNAAWTHPTGCDYMVAVADVTTDYGDIPIRKPIANTLSDLAYKIVEETTVREKTEYISLTEHAGILFSQGTIIKAGISTTTTSLPTKYLRDRYVVADFLQFSALGEAHFNMSGGLDASSILAFLAAEKRLEQNRRPKDLVSIPTGLSEHIKNDPSYIFKRLGFYESIGRIKPYHLKHLESLTLLGLLESALNIPGHLAIPLIKSLQTTS